jgi:hypothetical protein
VISAQKMTLVRLCPEIVGQILDMGGLDVVSLPSP